MVPIVLTIFKKYKILHCSSSNMIPIASMVDKLGMCFVYAMIG
jgi:hypothetical protein